MGSLTTSQQHIFNDLPRDNVYTVTVDHGGTIQNMIRAGKYDHVSPFITDQNFPSNKKGITRVTLRLFNFGHTISTGDARKNFNARGYRPIDIFTLLAFGHQHPYVQHLYNIVALGSDCFNEHPLLSSTKKNERKLDLRNGMLGWDEDDRFGIVTKEQQN